jgi:hypothetical protein
MAGSAQTRVATRGFVVRLVAVILAVTFLPLGVAFLVIGLAGGGDSFVPVGAALAAVGLLLVLAWALLSARARKALEREEAARSARATATVEEVRLHPYVRIGTLITVTLTVAFAPSGSTRSFSRRLHLSPLARIEAGQAIEVAYDREDPANFMPVA